MRFEVSPPWHFYREGFCVIIRKRSNPSLISSLCPHVKLWFITIVLLPFWPETQSFIYYLTSQITWIIQYQTKGKLPNTKSVFCRNWGAASVTSAGSVLPTNCYWSDSQTGEARVRLKRMGAAAAFDSLCWEKCHEDFVSVEGSRRCFAPAASQRAEQKIKIWQRGSSGESPDVLPLPLLLLAVAVAAVAASTAGWSWQHC